MHFSCESCKTNLMIADEKVRGKRLVVRCKRCGAKITISDPALAHRSAPPPAAKPTPGELDHHPRETDTESTRAMDSELLEKAVQASRRDEPLALDATNGAARSKPAPAPPPPAAPAAEPAIWFAMLAGKQTGPLTRAELDEKTAQGSVGPRTYLWKEGMPSWQRAKELPELAPLFPAPPPPLPPPINEHPVARPLGASIRTPVPGETKPITKPIKVSAPKQKEKEKEKEEERTTVDPLPLGERVHQEKVASELFTAEPSRSAADLARWASEELTKKPRTERQRQAVISADKMFARASDHGSRAPLVVVFLVLLAAAAVAAWLYFSPRVDAPGPPASAAPPRQPVRRPEQTPAPPSPEKPAEAPPQQTGLTADQVRKKLDENKSALQGCIDEALKRDPNLRVGKIHIATTIAPSGQVTTARIDKRTVNESQLGSCLKRATMHIAFPAFAGDPFDVDIPIVVTATE